ncbi:MAG: hypothetical protein ACR2HG_11965 [Pyrinomonadaceae bacterium]
MSKLKINKLGVLSVAKIQGAVLFVLGLIIGIIYGIIIIAISLLGAGIGGRGNLIAGGGGVVMGIVMMILFPVMYGAMGFVGGAISALLYNFFARMVGGIEMEIENIP